MLQEWKCFTDPFFFFFQGKEPEKEDFVPPSKYFLFIMGSPWEKEALYFAAACNLCSISTGGINP